MLGYDRAAGRERSRRRRKVDGQFVFELRKRLLLVVLRELRDRINVVLLTFHGRESKTLPPGAQGAPRPPGRFSSDQSAVSE